MSYVHRREPGDIVQHDRWREGLGPRVGLVVCRVSPEAVRVAWVDRAGEFLGPSEVPDEVLDGLGAGPERYALTKRLWGCKGALVLGGEKYIVPVMASRLTATRVGHLSKNQQAMLHHVVTANERGEGYYVKDSDKRVAAARERTLKSLAYELVDHHWCWTPVSDPWVMKTLERSAAHGEREQRLKATASLQRLLGQDERSAYAEALGLGHDARPEAILSRILVLKLAVEEAPRYAREAAAGKRPLQSRLAAGGGSGGTHGR